VAGTQKEILITLRSIFLFLISKEFLGTRVYARVCVSMRADDV